MPRDVVPVGDDKVEVRGLSRSEAVQLQGFGGDLDAMETYILSRGAGVSEAEAKEWRDSSRPDAVGVVVDRIIELSALDGDQGKASSGP